MRPKNIRRDSKLHSLHFSCEQLEHRTLLSSAILLKDVNTGTLGNAVIPLARIGTTAYVAANDGVHGQELYVSDGTTAGTRLVSDINPGAGNGVITAYNGASAAALNNICYFIGESPSTGYYPALYRSDSTAGGTNAIKQIPTVYQLMGFAATSSKVFFTFNGMAGPWVSDGTAAGTYQIGQVVPALSSLTFESMVAVNNKLFFVEANSSNQYSLYVTDGTAAGTLLLKSNVGGSLFYAGSRVVFNAIGTSTTDIWSSDGTVAGTTLISASKTLDQYASSSTKAFFTEFDGGTSAKNLYTTDGTATGTVLAKTGLGFMRPGIGLLPNGNALFVQEVGSTMTLFRSDGTSAGTIALQSLDSANDQNFVVTDVGTVGVFAARDTNGTELWKSDGTAAGTTILPINNYAQAGPNDFLGAGSPVYFAANDGVHGNELWKTDGTTTGTALVADIDQQPASSDPSGYTLINGKVWFSATSTAGMQPWVTDGTTAGTTVINTNLSVERNPGGYVGVGTKVFFYAHNPTTYVTSLYVYNGSTISLVQNASAQPANLGEYGAFNNSLYLAGSPGGSYYLWKTDGTAAGTTEISTTQTIEGYDPFVVSGSTMYFVGITGGNDELYAINSSNQITQLTTTFTGSSDPLYHSVVLNGKLYFAVDNAGGLQLWQSNGTAAGTTLVKQVTSNEVSSSGTIELTATNNTLYMATIDPASTLNTEIFKSDGTAAGTTLVKNLTGVQQGYSDAFVGVNGHLFFTATSTGTGGSSVETPWYSDGTAGNTYNLMPGLATNPYVQAATTSGNTLYFIALDSTHGNELWKSDGTVAGTALALDINPGSGDGFDQHLANYLAQIGGTLYLNANDGIHGNEPMVVYDQDTISGSASADPVALVQDSDHVNIDWTADGLSGKVPITDPSGLTLINTNGSDKIALNYTNGDPLPQKLHLVGTFTINGLTGSNPLANTNLEIGGSTIYITYANAASDPLSAIRGYLKNGFNNGTWTGVPTSTTGVITSTAAASNGSTSVGYADSADAGNPAGLTANTIELRYTVLGDTNLNGTVDINDYNAVIRNFGTGTTWDQGDVTYGASVSINDYNAVVRNFGVAVTSPAPMPTLISWQAMPSSGSQLMASTNDGDLTLLHEWHTAGRKTGRKGSISNRRAGVNLKS